MALFEDDPVGDALGPAIPQGMDQGVQATNWDWSKMPQNAGDQVQAPQGPAAITPLVPSGFNLHTQEVDAENPPAPGAAVNPYQGVAQKTGGAATPGASPAAKPGRSWKDVIDRLLSGFGGERQAPQPGASTWGQALAGGPKFSGGAPTWTSDVRAKDNLRSAAPEARSLLNALAQQGPTGWEWNDETKNRGTAYGTTTTALKQGGPMGQAMVDRSGKLEKIDGAGAIRGMLAAMAEQQRQIDDLRGIPRVKLNTTGPKVPDLGPSTPGRPLTPEETEALRPRFRFQSESTMMPEGAPAPDFPPEWGVRPRTAGR